MSLVEVIGSEVAGVIREFELATVSDSLRPSEQAPVDGFCEDVTLNRFHHDGARLESVARWFHVQLGVQGVELKHVVMERTIRAGSRTAVHGSCGADLITSVGQLRSLGYAFGQAARGRRNVPKNPMRLIVSSLVAGEIHVVHVEEETLRADGHVSPAHRRRRTFADANAGSGLTELNGNLAAVGKPRNGQSHGWRRSSTFRLASAACILSR